MRQSIVNASYEIYSSITGMPYFPLTEAGCFGEGITPDEVSVTACSGGKITQKGSLSTKSLDYF